MDLARESHYFLDNSVISDSLSPLWTSSSRHGDVISLENLDQKDPSLFEKARDKAPPPLRFPLMESIRKWDFGSLRTYYSVEPHEKFQEDELLDISLLPRLQEELWKAQSRIKELEAEKIGSMDNIRSFTRNQKNEREESNGAFVEYLKEKLRREKKETKRAKAENSMLKKKISEMESSTNRLRRERNTLEKVCEELVMRIDELKANTRRLLDETNEERQMLQRTDMWREEKVRVKLIDAKLTLQEKCEEMNWLVVELEKCLEKAREVGGIEETSLRRGEWLIKTARSFEVAHNNMDFESFRYLSEEDTV